MSAASFVLLEGDPSTWGVPPVGKTFLGINLAGVPTAVNNDGSGHPVVTPLVSAAPGVLAFANAAGTSTLTPSAGVTTALGVISGTARTVPLVLATAGMVDGQTIEVQLSFPALDNLIMSFYNTVGSGMPIISWQSASASNVVNGVWKFVYQTATGLWALVSARTPAY